MRTVVSAALVSAALLSLGGPAAAQSDRDRLFMVDERSGILVYETRTGREIDRIPLRAPVRYNAASRDGRALYILTDGRVEVIDTQRGEVTSVVAVPAGMETVAAVPGEDLIAVAGSAGFAAVAPSGSVLMRFPGGGRVVDLEVSPDGRFAYVLDTAADSVRVYDLGRRILDDEIRLSDVVRMAVGPDGTVYVGGQGATGTAIDPRTRATRPIALHPTGVVGDLVITEDGRALYAPTADGVVEVALEEQAPPRLLGGPAPAFAIATGPTGTVFAGSRGSSGITVHGATGVDRIATPAPAGFLLFAGADGVAPTNTRTETTTTAPTGSAPSTTAPTSVPRSSVSNPPATTLTTPVPTTAPAPEAPGEPLASTGVALVLPLVVAGALLAAGTVAFGIARKRR